MRWDLILPGLATLLASLTGLQAFERDSPPKVTDPKLKAKLEFAVTAVTAIGSEDEWRRVYNPSEPDPNKRVTTQVCGTRLLTLSVKCISYDHSPMNSAEWFLERIYTRLGFPSSCATLRGIDCAWVDSGSFVNLSASLRPEDRVFSVGQKDFMFTTAVNEIADGDPDYDGPMGTIDSVVLTSIYLYGVDGNPLTTQIGPTTIGPA